MALLHTKDFEIDISLRTGYSPVLHGCRGCSLHVRVVGDCSFYILCIIIHISGIIQGTIAMTHTHVPVV